MSTQPRRDFMKTVGLTGAGLMAAPSITLANWKNEIPVACQQYVWFSYFRRAGVEWGKDLKKDVKAMVSAGFKGYEPSFTSANEVKPLHDALSKGKVWAKSMYVNSTLHEESEVEKSISNALGIAAEAKKMGVEIVVTNPSPIQWGQPIDKDEQQLKLQAKALNRLGAELRNTGLKLAYHNHDMEMRQSAREFHHMMLGTDPENVHLCFDAHWIYRGAGNSQVAMFDILKLYGKRVVELHIRQSTGGIWSEVFDGEGDIDYHRLAAEFKGLNVNPHLVLEQAVEEGTSNSMTPVEAICASLKNVYEVF